MQRDTFQLIWHYLIIGMGSALVIALVAANDGGTVWYWGVQPILIASFVAGLVLGACSHVAYQFITQAGNSEKPLILISGVIFIIATLCVSGGMMLMLYIPLYLECLLLMQIEKHLPEEKPKRKNSI